MSDESANKRTHGRRHSRSPAEVSRLQRTRNAHQHGRRGALLPTPFPGFIYITEAADKGFLGILLQGRGSGPQGRVERTHWPPTSLSGLTVTRPHAIRKHNTPLADSGSQSVGLTHSPAPIGHSNARHRGAVFSPEDRAHSGPRTQTALSVALKFVQRDSGSISKPPSPKFLPSRWQPPPRAWACERRLCRWTRRGKGLRGARSVPCATTGRKAGAPQRGPITNPSSASPAAPARAPPPVPRPAAAGVRAPSRAPAAGGARGASGKGRGRRAGAGGRRSRRPAPRASAPRPLTSEMRRPQRQRLRDSAASDPVPGLRSRRRSPRRPRPRPPASAPGPAHAPRAARSLGSAAPARPARPGRPARPAPRPPGAPRPASRPLPYKAGRRGPRGHTARRAGAAPPGPPGPPAGPRAPGDGGARGPPSRLGRSGASLSAETLWVRAGGRRCGLGTPRSGCRGRGVGAPCERRGTAGARGERPGAVGPGTGRRAQLGRPGGGGVGAGCNLTPAGGDRSSCPPGPRAARVKAQTSEALPLSPSFSGHLLPSHLQAVSSRAPPLP